MAIVTRNKNEEPIAPPQYILDIIEQSETVREETVIHGPDLWQWDQDRYVIFQRFVPGLSAMFACVGDVECLTVEVAKIDGEWRANIPNILLQRGTNIQLYMMYQDATVYVKEFICIPRPKPGDYVYHPTEILSIHRIEEQVQDIWGWLEVNLKPATDVDLGLIKVGSGLEIDGDGVLSALAPVEVRSIPDSFIDSLE